MMERNDIITNTAARKKSTHSATTLTRFGLVAFALLLFAAFVAIPYVVGPSASGEMMNNEPTREEVLARLATAGVWAAGEPTVTKLAGVGELKKAKPVIYGNAKDGQYEARWPTLLVIYDYENDAVVSSLSITQVRLP